MKLVLIEISLCANFHEKQKTHKVRAICISYFSLQHRRAWLFGHCLSTKSKPEIVNFDASGLLGGIIYEGRKPGSDPDSGLGIPGLSTPGGEPRYNYKRRIIKLQCFPLYSVLKALGNPTVHYLRYI